MIAQNEAISFHSRDQTLNINLTKEQQCFSLLNSSFQDEQRSNEQCQSNNNTCDHLDESYEEAEREQNPCENYHNLMSVQQRDNNLNAILTRYTQLDDFRAVERLEGESVATEPEAVAAGTLLEAAPKKSVDSDSKQLSRKSSSKSSLNIKVESRNNDNNESLINSNVGGVDGDRDDDNATPVAIK